MLRLVLLLTALVAASPVRSDPSAPDLGGLISTVAAPFLSREAVIAQLDAALAHLQTAPQRAAPPATEGDPYYWSLEGRFGLPRDDTPAPGGIVTCARYGRVTLERLQALPSSDPQVFPLMRQAAILHDDARAWPEQAVARLVCLVTWDDARRVAPLGRAMVVGRLSEHFTSVTSGPDPAETPGSLRVFGPGGYVIAAEDGPANMVRVMDRAEVRQVATHQLILLRSYLLGGGA